MAKKLRYREIIFLQKRINNKNSVKAGLRRMFGIGLYRSFNLMCKLGFSQSVPLHKFSKVNLKKIEGFINNFSSDIFENDLKNHLKANIELKKNINSFQGFRHKMRLPVNGQRSRTNAKTQKRNKKTIW